MNVKSVIIVMEVKYVMNATLNYVNNVNMHLITALNATKIWLQMMMEFVNVS